MGLLDFLTPQPEPAAKRNPLPNVKQQVHGDITWIDVQDPRSDTLAGIGEQYNFHVLHTSKSLQVGHIARLEREKDYLFLLLHFPYLDVASNKIVTRQVMVFLGKDYLITVHDGDTQTVRHLFEAETGKSPADIKSAAHILYNLIGGLLDEVEKLTGEISVELDAIEDNVFDNEDSDAHQISQLRHKIMRLRRTLATQKVVFEELDDVIDKFSGEHLERFYTHNTNRSARLWETVEEARETIEIYKDADFISSTERTNEILAILTIIFTLGIPATVFGTFYGMNVPMPGSIEAGPWTFLGKYTTLIIILAASTVPAIAMYVYFKRKKWF